MSPYFESIRVQNRQICLLQYHTNRLNKTRAALFGSLDRLDLVIRIPKFVNEGIWKCRVVYGEAIEQVTFEPYTPRTTKSYKLLVAPPNFQYAFKGDRTALQALYKKRDEKDDIIIIQNGYLTDTYWANIVLSQGQQWYTPATPLLNGTMRQYLLDTGIITAKNIRPEDLSEYDQIMSINALNPFNPAKAVSVRSIE